jgi:hypothetical protein
MPPGEVSRNLLLQPKVLAQPTPMRGSTSSIEGKGEDSLGSILPGVTYQFQPGFNANVQQLWFVDWEQGVSSEPDRTTATKKTLIPV